MPESLNNTSPSPGSSPAYPPVPLKNTRRFGGMTWILIGIAAIFAIGVVFSTLRKNVAPSLSSGNAARSHVGISEFENAEGGVTFRDVYPPDGPADKAGLVGGDILVAFDGRATVDKRTMKELLFLTPPGKTVEVVYIRDGEQKMVQLTTISAAESESLHSAFFNRPEPAGQFGFENGRVVPVSGTKIKGVLLEKIYPSGPAAIAGIQVGDIVIEFDGVPIRAVGELVVRARRALPNSTVKVVVMRGTERLEVPVKIGKRG